MKLRTIFFLFFSLSFIAVIGQTINTDTARAGQSCISGKKYFETENFDSAIFYFEDAKEIYTRNLGDDCLQNANILDLLGQTFYKKTFNDKALEYHLKALEIWKEKLGENNVDVAKSYYNIGLDYKNKGEYDTALEYLFKALQIKIEILGEKNADVALCYTNIGNVYHYKGIDDKSLEYNYKALQIRIEIFGEKHNEVASSYNNIGLAYNAMDDYDRALEYYFKALQIKTEILGEKHTDVGRINNNIGLVYFNKGENDLALNYFSKALLILKNTFGENHNVVAIIYNNIGSVLRDKAEYDKALENFIKALQINKEILGEKHPDVANNYAGIGDIYFVKSEYNLALEYNSKALQIREEIFGEKHPYVASSYTLIGNIYDAKGECNMALEYYLKALQINIEIFGKLHSSVADSYKDIGYVYYEKNEYDKALEFTNYALNINTEIFGENDPDLAANYSCLGNVHYVKGEYDKALEYYNKVLTILKKSYGEKHPDVATSYCNLGLVYYNKNEYNKSLEYYNKSVASCLRNYNDTLNIYSVPIIKDYLAWKFLLNALYAKAGIITVKSPEFKDLSYPERKKIALRHYQACDTLIDITRKEISTQSDKLALGELSTQVYKKAIDILIPLQPPDDSQGRNKIPRKDADMAFYFSEKNKSTVLLEALAGLEAIKFAGIPDSLLEKEQNLKVDIAFYTKKISDPENIDSIQTALFQNKLFYFNRRYDSLIRVFEKQFPEYHNLKYNNKTATVKDVQKLIDNKTAMLSYIIGDSTITIFTITKNKLDVQQVPMMANLNDSILWFRLGLTNQSSRMQETYKRLGYKLYQQLFPPQLIENNPIENLIIIPDGELAIIPFEALLTANYTGDINLYHEYPYLVKKYNVSYTYSASLFNLTFSRQASSTIEIKQLNDWLALAPVFDNSNKQSMALSSRELQRKLNELKTDSLMTTRLMFDRSYINPLPATETETEAIFNLYDDNNLKAKVLLRDNANERFIKAGGLEQYKVLHFATHGFVNSEKPELSGILLEQDTTGGEDGILFSGEIYNLKLNADLVVLSACETGLGKIQKGEGIIGLTRALLYAGSKNIIVSLWQVADESTSDLMIDLYKNTIENKGKTSYSEALRNAKIKMINERKYSHPLYWSPFILIGK